MDLFAQAAVDSGIISRLILATALIAARLVPVFAFVPFFGGRLVPAPIRVGIAVAFALILLPVMGDPVTAAWAVDPSPVLIAVLLGKEILVGLTLGFVASLPFYAADAAGRLADVARGAQQSQILVPQTGERSTPLGDFSLQLAIVVFLLLDGHLLFLQSLATSYEAVPILTTPSAAGWGGAGQVAISASAHMIAAAVGLAAPVLAATFLSDLTLGLINRVAPQVQVYFVGMPVKAVLGIFVFMLALGAFTTALAGESAGGIRSLLEGIRGLAR